MSEALPPPAGPPAAASAPAVGEDLADGEWHRLHPATPLLRGGVVVVAALAIVLGILREELIRFFVPESSFCDEGEDFCGPGDPLVELAESGNLVLALLGLAVLLVFVIAGFWLSWRMRAFRVTDEIVEVKSGILFRTHRQGRLDRIQGINVVRPLLARIFGAAKLEVTVAGQDANIQLAYLSGRKADALRSAILRLASGSRRAATRPTAPSEPVGAGGLVSTGSTGSSSAPESLVERRLHEFTAPELDPSLAPPQSIVRMTAGRLIGSTLLSGLPTPLLVIVLGVIAVAVSAGESFPFVVPILLGSLIPAFIGIGSYAINRVVKSLRFTIASTPDGIRVGYGLLSTSNETLPPGRIHSLSVSQPLLWRPFDWWEVKVNRAGTSSAQGAAGQRNTTILPVGSREDAFRVIELVMPTLEGEELRGLVARGLATGAPGDGYTTSPRRAAVIRWFSWRRNGYALAADVVLLRRGAIWRELVIVPTARMQSVALRQGPLLRALGLAAVHSHTVLGPVSTRLGALDRADAESFFREAALLGVTAAGADRSQRWGQA